MSVSETNVLYGTRDAGTWPRHKTKAKSRAMRRAAVARKAQADRDAKRGE